MHWRVENEGCCSKAEKRGKGFGETKGRKVVLGERRRYNHETQTGSKGKSRRVKEDNRRGPNETSTSLGLARS